MDCPTRSAEPSRGLPKTKICVGGFTEGEEKVIDEALLVMPPKLLRSVFVIQSRDPLHFKNNNVAHYSHKWWMICLNKKHEVAKNTIWHEAAHAFHHYSVEYRRLNFEVAWLKIHASQELCWPYGMSCRMGNRFSWMSTDSQEPDNGCLTPYGGWNIYEDVAVYCEGIYCLLYEESEISENLLKIPTDEESVYWRKIALLRDYEFITEEQYQNTVQRLRARYK